MTALVQRFNDGGYDPFHPSDNVVDEWDLTTYTRFDETGAVVETRPVTAPEYAVAAERYLSEIAPDIARDEVLRQGIEQRSLLAGIEIAAHAYAAAPATTPEAMGAHLVRVTYAIEQIARTLRGLILWNVGDFGPNTELGIPAPPPPPPEPPVDPDAEPPALQE